jgi:hypothetical protein
MLSDKLVVSNAAGNPLNLDVMLPKVPARICIRAPVKLAPGDDKLITGFTEVAVNWYQTSYPVGFVNIGSPADAVAFTTVPPVLVQLKPGVSVSASV